MTSICFMLLLMLASCFQESDESLKAMAKLVKERTQKTIESNELRLKELQETLGKAKKAKIDRRVETVAEKESREFLGRGRARQRVDDKGIVTFHDKVEKQAAIKDAEEQIADLTVYLDKLKKGEEFVWGRMEFPLALGNYGSLHEGGSIEQVIDGESALITVFYTYPNLVKSVERVERVERLVMFKGIDTTGMTDGAGWDSKDDVYGVTETTQYPTAIGGTKTVFVLRPVDKAKVEALLKK